jgi:hypothetical protein
MIYEIKTTSRSTYYIDSDKNMEELLVELIHKPCVYVSDDAYLLLNENYTNPTLLRTSLIESLQEFEPENPMN